MKRIVLTVMAVLLCFMLLGCEKEPVKTDLPNIEETVTPSEIETPETPVEFEQPTETEEPTEPEEPTESTQTEENVIILPEADEDTIHITIDFPEDFPEEPYTEPNLVSPEEFEWGEYVPFVRYYDSASSMRNMPCYTYSFLGESIQSLQDGNIVYDKLNELYKAKLQFDFDSFNENSFADDKSSLSYAKAFSESRIVGISEDLSRIEMFSGKYIESDSTNDLRYGSTWLSLYTVYKDKTPVFEYESLPKLLDSAETPESIKNKFIDYGYEKDIYYAMANQKAKTVYKSDKHIIFDTKDHSYCIYSLDERRMLYKINYPKSSGEKVSKGFTFVDFSEKNGIIFELYKIDANNDNKYYSKTYIYDLQKNEFGFLENFSFNAKLSPDGKLLVYTNSNYENTLQEQKCGYYVKNLQNNTTVFYPALSDYVSVWTPVSVVEGFVDKHKLLNAISA